MLQMPSYPAGLARICCSNAHHLLPSTGLLYALAPESFPFGQTRTSNPYGKTALMLVVFPVGSAGSLAPADKNIKIKGEFE